MSIKSLFNTFAPPEAIAQINCSNTVDKSYKYWRIRILYSMFIGYAVYYFTRGTFALAMPELKQLGIDEVALGWIATSFQLAYAGSKFGSGILADKSNPRYLMAIGLIFTGIVNIAFGFSSSIYLFLVFWTLNGVFQGFGSAPCHRLLTHWYSQSERGRWWSLWNTSHNVGAALLPIFAAPIIALWGWKYGMWIPGVFAVVTGLFLLNRLRDTPQSLGLPRVECYRNEKVNEEPSSETEKELSVREILFKYVLNSPLIWLLSIGFFFIQITRWAISQWSYHYLVDVQNFTHLAAAKSIFWFEVGGFLGGICAGFASDLLFKGRRSVINLIFSLALIPLIGLYSTAFTSGSHVMTQLVLFGGGFLLFGPHMMAMVAAAELTHKKASATAVGFLGIVAYIGCSFTGGPLGHLIRDCGWECYFQILYSLSIGSTICFLLIWVLTHFPLRIILKKVKLLPQSTTPGK